MRFTHRLDLICRGLVTAFVVGAICAGCSRGKRDEPQAQIATYDRFQTRKVPDFMKGSLYERMDLHFTEPLVISGYGLVKLPEPTGDSTAPLPVREYMLREMMKHGFGSYRIPGYENMTA